MLTDFSTWILIEQDHIIIEVWFGLIKKYSSGTQLGFSKLEYGHELRQLSKSKIEENPDGN